MTSKDVGTRRAEQGMHKAYMNADPKATAQAEGRWPHMSSGVPHLTGPPTP